jgi:C4-dicarboxylate-specific signal transduction histidine kinase
MISAARLSSLGEMAAGVAHEINNPVSIILGKVGLISRKIEAGQLDSDYLLTELSKITRTVSRIGSIVKGLRTFSRSAESDPMQSAKVSDLIEDSLSLCQAKFKNQGVQIDLKPIPEVAIQCRPTQIAQVFVNLLSNAFDAVRGDLSSVMQPWIRVEVIEKPDLIEVRVVDSGSGIPPDVVQKMMNPFFTTKPVGEGTGLGLSISSGIMKEHGGRLYYDADSINTTFVCEFRR